MTALCLQCVISSMKYVVFEELLYNMPFSSQRNFITVMCFPTQFSIFETGKLPILLIQSKNSEVAKKFLKLNMLGNLHFSIFFLKFKVKVFNNS